MNPRASISVIPAAGLLFVAIWIVVPGPILPLLALSIAARELSTWLLLIATIAALAAVGLRRHRDVRLTLSLVIAAGLLAALPLAEAALAARHFDKAMRAALGDGFLNEVPASIRGRWRSRPLAIVDLLRGVDAGDARVTDRIVFAAPDGAPLTLTVYRPVASRDLLPAVVQIYGGAWRSGMPGNSAHFARYLASHGYVVFAIDYRHAPRWRWPAQLADVRAALAWIRGHASEQGADATRLALVGRSSGAQLALLAAYEPGAVPVRAVVDYYGPTDLAEGYRHPPRPDPLGVRPILAAFLGGTPDELPAEYAAASPITYVTRRLPPTLLIHGGRDHIVEPRFSVMLHDRLRATGTTSVLLEIPWAEHAFDAIPSGPGAQLGLYFVERFLAWALTSH